MEDSFQQLISRLRQGDDHAAADLFNRYAQRLMRLASTRIDNRIRRKVDPDDVVQSVFRSFFQRQAAGKFEIGSWDQLWSLLVTLTVRKCARKAKHHGAARRDYRQELEPPSGESSAWEIISREPNADEATMLADAVEELLDSLPERSREIVALSLEGQDTPEIAGELNCSRRTVQRELLVVRRHLEEMQEG